MKHVLKNCVNQTYLVELDKDETFILPRTNDNFTYAMVFESEEKAYDYRDYLRENKIYSYMHVAITEE